MALKTRRPYLMDALHKEIGEGEEITTDPTLAIF